MVVYLRRKIRLKYILSVVCLIGFIYTVYQIRSVQELTKKTLKSTPPVRGVHMALHNLYNADVNYKFSCISDGKLISFDKVNDDYCDCDDGSDEPGTEACPNGKFYCTYETNHRHGWYLIVLLLIVITSSLIPHLLLAQPIPSGRVNDGICDCCDGSDEWKKIRLPFTSPCINVCWNYLKMKTVWNPEWITLGYIIV